MKPVVIIHHEKHQNLLDHLTYLCLDDLNLGFPELLPISSRSSSSRSSSLIKPIRKLIGRSNDSKSKIAICFLLWSHDLYQSNQPLLKKLKEYSKAIILVYSVSLDYSHLSSKNVKDLQQDLQPGLRPFLEEYEKELLVICFVRTLSKKQKKQIIEFCQSN